MPAAVMGTNYRSSSGARWRGQARRTGLGIVGVVAHRAVARRIAAGADGQGRFAIALDHAGALAITVLGGALFLAAWWSSAHGETPR
jgi:hypothetical protein